MKVFIILAIALSMIFGAVAYHGETLKKGIIEKELFVKMHDMD